MARDFSPEYLEQLRFPNLAGMHFLIKSRKVLMRVRNIQRKLDSLVGASPATSVAVVDRPLVTAALESGSEQFQSERWAFVKNVIDENFHQQLVAGWPKRKFLIPPADLLKSYDRGFDWWRGCKEDPPFLDKHPAIAAFFDYVRSDEFGQRITNFAGGDRQLSCYSFLLTNTWAGSLVAPHRDTIAFSPDGRHFLNIVFYISGSGGAGSGGLALLKDNKFDEVIFESPELTNTALVYDVSAPFYHGFRPVERGKYRWAIITNFCAADYMPS